MRFPGFIGPSYTAESANVDCQRTVNLYPVMNDLGSGKGGEVAFLAPTPGLRLLLTLGASPVRALWRASNGQLFAVGGNKMYRISSAWAATEIGTLNTSTGHVSMADNGTYVVAADGTNGYTWNVDTDTFATITDPDFLTADQVAFLDGYLLFNRADSQQFFFVDDASLNFNALDVAAAEGSPDDLVGLTVANRNVYLFGEQSTEVFYNTGDGADPFQRMQGAVNDIGCAAAFSIGKIGGTVFWLGGDERGTGIVYKMQGFSAQRISTTAIETVIRALDQTTLSTARAWTYQQGGHEFYCLNLPGDDTTWCYDSATGLWHERQYLNLWSMERHRADCHAVAYGENVVGDYENGNIYALDPLTYTDNSTSIARIRRAPHLSKDLKNLFHAQFQLDMETGVGLDGTGQGTSPEAILRFSDDGGHTWSNEKSASIGAIGKKKTRVKWNRLGRSRDRVYEVRITDPVKTVLIGADLQFEEGSS